MIERLPNYLHSRSLNHAGVDRVAEVHGVESAAGIHIRDCSEAGSQIDLRVSDRYQGALSGRLPACIDVHVSVDHARKSCRVPQVDDPGFTRDLDIGADIRDALPPDQHNLVVQQVARFGIEQLCSTNRHHLIGWREKFTFL